MARRFEIMDTTTRQYRQLTVRLIPPSDNSDPVVHFLTSVNDLFEHALRDVNDSDVVNRNDKPIGISFRRKDQLSGDVIWSFFERVLQSNSGFNTLDTLVITVHSVKMPVGFGKRAIRSMGRPLSVMADLKQCIVEVNSEKNCLAHALIIAIWRVDNDPNYKAYRQGRKVRPLVRNLLKTTGIDLSNGAGIPELVRFQKHFRDYRIVVCQGLSCDDLMVEGPVESAKRINYCTMTSKDTIT